MGINEFEGQGVYPVPQEHRERLSELAELCLFEPSSADEITYFRSGFFEVWDPTDLGREVVFTLRQTRPTWQTQPLLTANAVAEALGHRIDENNPLFSARLASFVSEVSVRSPSQLRIRFSRVPLSIESLLRFPITRDPQPGVQDTAAAQPVSLPTTPTVISTRFQPLKQEENMSSWVRSIP